MAQNRLQSSGTNIFHFAVYLESDAGQFTKGVVLETKFNLFSCQHGLILLGKGIFRLFQDLVEIIFRETLQLNTNREAALQLRNQVARFGYVESTGSNEQNMVGMNNAILCIHRTAFHNR